jgi:ribosomal protein S18 acetylase RimI-like enzyme
VGVISLHDKGTIETFLRKNADLHILSLGDLDDYFWPATTWYALESGQECLAIVLLYNSLPVPTLLAFSENLPPMRELIPSLSHLLPRRFTAHLTPGLEDLFRNGYRISPHGEYSKMALRDRSLAGAVDCSQVVRLDVAALDELVAFYSLTYPDNWFDSRMLQTGKYFAIKKDGKIVSAAGIHVYSEHYRVAALGNIATHSDFRNQGFGTAVTARLCQELSENMDHIGLNVRADNRAAISCYNRLGFETFASFGLYTLESRD